MHGVLLQFEVPLAIACLLVLLLGALMGTLAGVLRGVFNVPSFVATLVYGAPCAEWGCL